MERLSFEEMKELVRETISADMSGMSPSTQLLYRAIMASNNEPEAIKQLRKAFYRMDRETQIALVEGAFDDEEDATAPIRRLIYELPQAEQDRILGMAVAVRKPIWDTPVKKNPVEEDDIPF